MSSTRYETICNPTLVAASFLLNLPTAILNILGCFPWCDYFSGWMAANAALAVSNIFAAMYIVNRTQLAIESSPEEQHRPKEATEHQIGDSSPDIDELANLSASERDDYSYWSSCYCRLKRTPQSDRIRRLIRYDGFLSSHCIIFLFWIFWLGDGLERQKYIDLAEEEELQNCYGYHEEYVNLSCWFGYSYVGFCVFYVALSFLEIGFVED